MSYHQFANADGSTYGSFELWYQYSETSAPNGWYWHACFPGCLPDGEASGPFATEQDAIKDATDYI